MRAYHCFVNNVGNVKEIRRICKTVLLFNVQTVVQYWRTTVSPRALSFNQVTLNITFILKTQNVGRNWIIGFSVLFHVDPYNG